MLYVFNFGLLFISFDVLECVLESFVVFEVIIIGFHVGMTQTADPLITRGLVSTLDALRMCVYNFQMVILDPIQKVYRHLYDQSTI